MVCTFFASYKDGHINDLRGKVVGSSWEFVEEFSRSHGLEVRN
jgi:hypothetical protein